MARHVDCPDCGWLDVESRCIRCGSETYSWGDTRRFRCSPGCAPSADAPAPIEELAGEGGSCDHCEEDACARSMVATERGIYCTWECAGKAEQQALRERYEEQETSRVCPMCDDGVSSPAYGDTCSVRCQTEAEARAGGVIVCTCPAQYHPDDVVCMCPTRIPEAPKADSGDSAVARFGGAA